MPVAQRRAKANRISTTTSAAPYAAIPKGVNDSSRTQRPPHGSSSRTSVSTIPGTSNSTRSSVTALRPRACMWANLPG